MAILSAIDRSAQPELEAHPRRESQDPLVGGAGDDGVAVVAHNTVRCAFRRHVRSWVCKRRRVRQVEGLGPELNAEPPRKVEATGKAGVQVEEPRSPKTVVRGGAKGGRRDRGKRCGVEVRVRTVVPAQDANLGDQLVRKLRVTRCANRISRTQ